MDPLLGAFTGPLIVPVIDGLDALGAVTGGGAIDSRLVLFPAPGGFGAFEGVVVREVGPDELIEGVCLVGDVRGDCSGQTKEAFRFEQQDVPPTLSPGGPCLQA